MKTVEYIKVFLLGVLVAFTGMLVYQPSHGTVYADGTGVNVERDELGIATVGKDGSLFLINPKDKIICQYSTDGAGFSLRTARYYGHDIKIFEGSKKGTGFTQSLAKERADYFEKHPPDTR